MKILNAYSGIGGNRRLWGDEHEITAVENDSKVATIYNDFFPNDKILVEDAHQYLLEHFKEFDFIWSSPPCPTHSRARFWGWSKKRPVYPDMRLYQEILFLAYHCDSKWAVENVIPYYKIPAFSETSIFSRQLGRHIVWSNFYLEKRDFKCNDIRKLSGTSKKDKMKRNIVNPELGLHVFNEAFKNNQQTLI